MTVTNIDCAVCSGTGFRYIGEPHHERAVRCECLKQAVIDSTLPPRYRGASLEQFEERAANFVRLWLTMPTDGLFVTGPVGTGKTHLACALARTAIDLGKRVSFVRCCDLYAEIRRTFNDETGSTEGDILDRYASAPILVLDDFGAGSLSDFERRTALDIIDSRLNHRRPTVVTTNLALTRIREVMDERIASRLSSFTPFRLIGPDRRAQGTPPGVRPAGNARAATCL
ncbi:MAG: ATP-binding protein [Terriglobia bacterium]|nr:ATP-binding protein [Terriglobia bacterium]